MEFTPGEIYFYSGIAGTIIIFILFALNMILIAKKRKKLFKLLNEEYGGWKR